MAAAIARGHEALALTDHDSLSGSMEFAQAARSLGLRAIHGAEVTLDDGRHLTLLVRDATGWRNLCRLLTRAHAHTRDGPQRDRAEPAVSLDDVEAHHEGLVCLSGCARSGIRDEPTMRRLLCGLRPRRLPRRAAAPARPPRPGAEPRSGGAGARLGVATVATGNVHAHSPERARLQDVFVAIREHTTLDASEPLRRGNHAHVLSTPQAMAARFADHPEAVAETARLAETLTFDLAQRPRLPLPGRRGRDREPRARRGLRGALRRALPARQRAPRGGQGAPGGGAARHRRARPRRLLPPAPRPARARARGGRRGARARGPGRGDEPPLAAAARPRPRLERLLDRLPPHRPQPRRPDRQQAAARALPQRGAHRPAGHRPRLPARHPRRS